MDALGLLKEEHKRIGAAIKALEGRKSRVGRRAKRRMSKAAKKKLSKALKAAWKKRQNGK